MALTFVITSDTVTPSRDSAWHNAKETRMKEQTSLSPDEARDFGEKLDAFAKELSPRQVEYLRALLRAGAQAGEIQGYTYEMTFSSFHETVVCTYVGCGYTKQTTCEASVCEICFTQP
jgi:hypothetical protein